MDVSGPLYPRGKSPPPMYELDRRPGGPHIRSGNVREEKILAPYGIQPGPSSLQPVSIPISKHHLKFSKSLEVKRCLQTNRQTKEDIIYSLWVHVILKGMHKPVN
jgi:hypothetical protein